jgi:hypothetical protein
VKKTETQRDDQPSPYYTNKATAESKFRPTSLGPTSLVPLAHRKLLYISKSVSRDHGSCCGYTTLPCEAMCMEVIISYIQTIQILHRGKIASGSGEGASRMSKRWV